MLDVGTGLSLLQLVAPLLPKVKRLRAERRARKSSSSLPITQALIQSELRKTYDRLANNKLNASWWEKIKVGLGHLAISPQLIGTVTKSLDREIVQQWLQETEVKQTFLDLGEKYLIGTPTEPEIASLNESLQIRLPEPLRSSSDQLIDDVLGVLVAGYLAELSPGERLILHKSEQDNSRQLATLERMDEGFHRKLESLTQDALVTQVHSDQAKRVLENILKIAHLDQAPSQKAKFLVKRLESGDLRYADRNTKKECFEWAARFLALQPGELETARELRRKLEELDPEHSLQLVDAAIYRGENQTDQALRILRQVDSPVARTALFSLLTQEKGRAKALSWLQNNVDCTTSEAFTGPGWYNLAVALAEEEKWNKALDVLHTARVLQSKFPDLSFLEGIIHTALLVPSELRPLVLEFRIFDSKIAQLEGKQSDDHRVQAIQCFEKASTLLAPLDKSRGELARLHLSWLQLTHPDEEVRQEAENELRAILEDSSNSLSFVALALEFGIESRFERFWQRLQQAEEAGGGLDDHEQQVQLALARAELQPDHFVAFLYGRSSRLQDILGAKEFHAIYTAALIDSEQFAKARIYIDQHAGELEEITPRLRTQLSAALGEDFLSPLIESFKESDSLLDLKNLCHYLQQQDMAAAEPYLRELFHRERTTANALALIEAIHVQEDQHPQAIKEILEQNSDLVDTNVDLKRVMARTLLNLGQLRDAERLSAQFQAADRSLFDLQLEINIALQGGTWERFPGLVERAWGQRSQLDSKTLFSIATLAAHSPITHSQTIELLEQATAETSDPQLLMSAYELAMRIGRDDPQTASWLKQAVELASEDGKPVRMVTYRELAKEILPAQRQVQETIFSLLKRADIPLHLLAGQRHIPLARLLIQIPEQNQREKDGRRRQFVPIVSGSRHPVTIHQDWTLGLDLSSLMVFHQIGILPQTLKTLRKVIIAPDTIPALLSDYHQIQFHQPKLAAAAREILELLSTKILEVAPPSPQYSHSELHRELGPELADLLLEAKKKSGIVVCPEPITNVSSLDLDPADISEYQEYLISTRQFEQYLFEQGLLDEETHEQASLYLENQDSGTPNEAALSLEGIQVFLSGLALDYCQAAGLLEGLRASRLSLLIHESTYRGHQATIREQDVSTRTAERIDDLRKILRRAVEDGKVQFLPHISGPETRQLSQRLGMVGRFAVDLGLCDAVCIDDRHLNASRYIADSKGTKIPVVCVLDLLSHLETHGQITKRQHFQYLGRLRAGGFGHIPYSAEELRQYLASPLVSSSNKPKEPPELRLIRQGIAQIIAEGWLALPQEAQLVTQRLQTNTETFDLLWQDTDLSETLRDSHSSYIWTHLQQPFLGLSPDSDGDVEFKADNYAEGLLILPPLQYLFQSQDLANWIETTLLRTLLAANSRVIDRTAQCLGFHLLASCERFAAAQEQSIEPPATSDLALKMMIRRLPPLLRCRVLDNASIIARLKLPARTLSLTIGSAEGVRSDEIIRAVQQNLSTGEPAKVGSFEALQVTSQEDRLLFEILQEGGEPRVLSLPTLDLLSSSKERRTETLSAILSAVGAAATTEIYDLCEAVETRPLNGPEFNTVTEEWLTGVAALQRSLRESLTTGTAALADLFPTSANYYEHFCGPAPGAASQEEYLSKVLPCYRKQLLDQNLESGLEICLLGALHDKLCPGSWLQPYDDDQVWEALLNAKPWLDPFSLLAALDICLYRVPDERFLMLLDLARKKLLGPRFFVEVQIDAYKAIPLLGELGLATLRLGTMENDHPPFWHRLCAWTQALQALRSHPLERMIDTSSLRELIERNLDARSTLAKWIDLREEPLVLSHLFTSERLEQEVLRRVAQIARRHGELGHCEQQVEELLKATAAAAARMKLPLSFLWHPGPLESNARPGLRETGLAKDISVILASSTEDQELARDAAFAAQAVPLTTETRVSLLHALERISKTGDLKALIETAISVGSVAAAERDSVLADSVASSILFRVPEMAFEEVARSLEAILVSAAAYSEERPWAAWLQVVLSRLAWTAEQDVSRDLWHLLAALQEVTPLELDIVRPALTISSLGAAD